MNATKNDLKIYDALSIVTVIGFDSKPEDSGGLPDAQRSRFQAILTAIVPLLRAKSTRVAGAAGKNCWAITTRSIES